MTRDDFSDEEPEVSIFGNAEVFIEKDTEKREWRVWSKEPPRQHLCTIPWAHALKEWPYAKDYDVAVKTCMANEIAALSDEELAEEMAREELRAMGVDPDSEPNVEPVPEPEPTSNVIPFPKRG